jgi:hypothetical protein
VALAQRLLQRRVQLARVDVALVQVALHEGGVHLHHLFHQRAVRVGHGRKIGRSGGREEAVRDPGRAVGRQVERQAFAAEAGLDLRQQAGQVGAGASILLITMSRASRAGRRSPAGAGPSAPGRSAR